MKTVYKKHFPFKGYKAIMLFGVIFARKEYKPLSEIDINHEKIHREQARDCGGYVWYYLKYAYYYVKYGFSYRRNPFEREEYYFQSDLGYIERYREKRSWKKFHI
jgi:hypothetical protein